MPSALSLSGAERAPPSPPSEAWGWNTPHPSSSGLHSCNWVRYHPPGCIRESPMCVRNSFDIISNSISSYGKWPECDDLSTLFARFAHRNDDLVLDIGANIGACTLSLLLDTDCLLYTSDAADDLTRVDLGGRRIIKKKKTPHPPPPPPDAPPPSLFFFFFSSRRRHTRFLYVSWARRCV